MEDLWRQVGEHLAEERREVTKWRTEIQRVLASKPFAEVVGRGVDELLKGTVFPRFGPMSEDEAMEAAIELALELNPEGGADMPQDPAERAGAVLAAHREWQSQRWDAWEWGDGRDKGPNPYRRA